MQTQSSEELAVRRVIKDRIANWDRAYAEGSARGMTGHYISGDRRRKEQCHQNWRAVMDWMEEATARSIVRHFHLTGEQATATVGQCRSFSFRSPLPTYAPPGRALLGLLTRFVFLEREVSHLAWVKTREGWLCQSERRLSYRLRIRLRAKVGPSGPRAW